MSQPLESSNNTINLAHQSLGAAELQNLVVSVGCLDTQQIFTIKLGFNNLRDEGAKVVASVLMKNSSITSLDLGFCSISDEGVAALSKSLIQNSTLKILYLSGNSISENGFRHLGMALQKNRSLEALYLTGNRGRAEGSRLIAKGLQYNHSLTKLFLNGNHIEGEGASSISDILKSNHSVTHLNMSDNNIGDNGLCSLADALLHHRKLSDLELSFSKLTSVGMSTFVDSLVGYHQLRRLLLDNNKLGDGGAKALARALPEMSLHVLNVGFNEIGSEGLSAVLAYLSTPQSTLVSLTLSGNSIDNVVAKELANMLIGNLQLQELYIDRTNLTNIGERFIATGIASNKMCPIRILTGFELGNVLTQLGSPAAVAQMNNEQALKYLCQVWKDLERTAALQQQHMRLQQQAGYLLAQGQHSAAASVAAQANMLRMSMMQSGQNSGMGALVAPGETVSGLGSVGTSSPSELSATDGDPAVAMAAASAVYASYSAAAIPPPQQQVSISQQIQSAAGSSNAPSNSATTVVGLVAVPGGGMMYVPMQAVPAGAAVPNAAVGSTPQTFHPGAGGGTTGAVISTAPNTFVPMPKRTRSITGGSIGGGSGGPGGSINRPASSRPPSRTPPITHTRQLLQQQQIQQLQYQQQVERYHALLEAARQVPDLPFDARELQILTEFYYTPPSSVLDGRHHPHQQPQASQRGFSYASGTGSPYCNGSLPAKRATTVKDLTKSTIGQVLSVENPNNSNNNMTGLQQVTAAALAQLNRTHNSHSNVTQPSDGVTGNAAHSPTRLRSSTATSNHNLSPVYTGPMLGSVVGEEDNHSDSGTQTTVGHVHERSETNDDDDDVASNRPWKRASNLTTLPRINYFARIKSLLDELRSARSFGACLALLRQLRMLEISLLGLDALEIEEILLRDVLGLGRAVFHVSTSNVAASASAATATGSASGTEGAATPQPAMLSQQAQATQMAMYYPAYNSVNMS